MPPAGARNTGRPVWTASARSARRRAIEAGVAGVAVPGRGELGGATCSDSRSQSPA